MDNLYDLSGLGSQAFENLVNFLALKTLGLGATGFGPGADGGRDGFFEGEAPYPSAKQHWKGIWYIQSKFLRPHLSKDPQKWLIEQVQDEIAAFSAPHSRRTWPDNWIIATNIEPSGTPETGSFDAIRKLVRKSTGGRRVNVAVWGGRKVLDLLSTNSDVVDHFRHLLTPGHVLSALYSEIGDSRASLEDIARYFIVAQFSEHLYTKLDQANSSTDVRPGVHDLFIDLPFRTSGNARGNGILAELTSSAAFSHRYSIRKEIPESWGAWARQLRRARVALIKGGPGQGKSTIGQYLCQIHRAKLILSDDAPRVSASLKNLAKSIQAAAIASGFWPDAPRIPIQIELKEFAQWYSRRDDSEQRSVLVFLAEKIERKVGSDVLPKTLKRALSKRSWIVVFDGLDEVPNDSKDAIASEVMEFLNDILIDIDADALALCTSRPQGYSGQFSGIDGPVVELLQLGEKEAIKCAIPLLKFGRTAEEAETSIGTLEAAIKSPSIRELMTTPLQSHIMAVIVRDGGRPPERRWQLFSGFYQVMKKRESQKNFQNPVITRLLREEDRLLKAVHMRLGFVLHARAEVSAGAQTTLTREEFRRLVEDVVRELVDDDVARTTAAVLEATTERLVLVNTPESGEHVRFDIRQLQEFFAAEFLYSGVEAKELADRLRVIGGDAHWREVMHFVLSALIENQRPSEFALSVQVLRGFNEGDETDRSNLYARRTGRACLIALRLLAEGVLEQDRLDRQQIRPLLDPIGGLLDLRLLRKHSSLRLERSRQWLIALLTEKIATNSSREHIGALALLGWMLPSGDPTGDLAHVALVNSPIELQQILFGHWAPPYSLEMPSPRRLDIDKEDRPSAWVLRAALRILSSDKCMLYSTASVERMLRICVQGIDVLPKVATTDGFAEDITGAMGAFMNLYVDQHRLTRREIKKNRTNCGLVVGHAHQANWINGKLPKSLSKISASAAEGRIGGIFALMFACLRFAKERTPGALMSFTQLAKGAGSEKTCLLPSTLLALVPISSSYGRDPGGIKHLMNVDDPSIEALISRLRELIDPAFSLLELSDTAKDPTEKDCSLLARKLPSIAISWAFDVEHNNWRGPLKFVPELIDAITGYPEETVQNILRWGALASDHPELLQTIKSQSRNLSIASARLPYSVESRVHPFQLSLPDDIALLPFLAGAFAARARHAKENDLVLRRDRDVSLSKLLSGYGLDQISLRSIAESTAFDSAARAAATALRWLTQADIENRSDDHPSKLQLEIEFFFEFLSTSNDSWFVFAFIRGVLTNASENDPQARYAVTRLLDWSSDSASNRDDLVALLETWRERSEAPVHKKQALEKWLGYVFSPPIYAV
ncbi:NACHT domain-containing protein [Steroidobacter cummioxidans]|uniref:NACHT domain-containing protein n=1 Tax=Steroidobacter cummioxidans TaxID=1803913 RepID=UPI000E3202D5|nr:hypothetical protein [Steroidobacter cummioxidans]